MAAKLSESGIIGQDGQLYLPMDRLGDWATANRGKRVIALFVAVEPGSSAAQQAYYYNYVLLTVQQALKAKGERLTLDEVDYFLLDMYPGDKATLGNGTDATEARYLDRQQMTDFLDWLKQIVAEWLHVYIEDPKTI